QLHASPRGRWLRYLAGAGAVHEHYQNKDTEQAYGVHPNALEWDSFFLRRFFAGVPLPAPEPKIFLTEFEREQGQAFWRSWGVEPARVVVLGLGASRPTKRWPPRHFARLGELLRDR